MGTGRRGPDLAQFVSATAMKQTVAIWYERTDEDDATSANRGLYFQNVRRYKPMSN